ncbi:hypothetical protein DFJ77DRAFT_542334 [Powellomyces hirtus]|nr:hypothetical protein DFJ77DRAFT_542334 [Powellomyces hirtus]
MTSQTAVNNTEKYQAKLAARKRGDSTRQTKARAFAIHAAPIAKPAVSKLPGVCEAKPFNALAGLRRPVLRGEVPALTTALRECSISVAAESCSEEKVHKRCAEIREGEDAGATIFDSARSANSIPISSTRKERLSFTTTDSTTTVHRSAKNGNSLLPASFQHESQRTSEQRKTHTITDARSRDKAPQASIQLPIAVSVEDDDTEGLPDHRPIRSKSISQKETEQILLVPSSDVELPCSNSSLEVEPFSERSESPLLPSSPHPTAFPGDPSSDKLQTHTSRSPPPQRKRMSKPKKPQKQRGEPDVIRSSEAAAKSIPTLPSSAPRTRAACRAQGITPVVKITWGGATTADFERVSRID